MKKIQLILHLLFLILLIAALSCGADNTNKTNSAPVADAGADKTVTINTLVILDGSKSSDPEGDSFTYKWSLSIPLQSLAVLSDSTSAKPKFTPDIEGTYIATLIVNDGTINSNPDSITINAEKLDIDISFSNDIQTIFNNNCIGCHSQESSASFLKLTSGVSYSNLVNISAEKSSGIRVVPSNSGNSILYLRISGSSVGAQMPKFGSPLNSQDQNLIKKWIDEGAKNN